MTGELERAGFAVEVRSCRDTGEWIRGSLRIEVSRYRERGSMSKDADVLRCAMEVIALGSLFGHHPGGEPAKWADSHLHDHDR